AVNDPPVAIPQSVATDEDTPLPVTLTGTDVDSTTLTFQIVAGPSHGSLSGTAPNVTYTPAANYNGPDTFTFQANDGSASNNLSNVATVTIKVGAGGTLQFNSATYSVTENAGTVTVTVTRTGSSNGAASIHYATVAGGTATGAAACAAGV